MMDWKEILVAPDFTIMQTMKLIDESALQFAVVIDENMRILGTVTDGDIRRGLLKGIPLDASIQKVMNEYPVFEKEGSPLYYYKAFMKRMKLKQLPIVNQEKQVQNVLFIDGLTQGIQKENTVVLMAGGLGTRLRPLTDHVPKPMLRIGEQPILETIIESFKSYGFVNFVLTVNYKKEVVKEYFQDGAHLDVHISYIEETNRLGTAGALSLLVEEQKSPLLVMNGDLLTKVNFDQLLNFHNETKSDATMCVREHEYQIPYGVLQTDNHRLISIEEKPIIKNFVNAGIYVLSPEVLKYVPENEYLDMPDLFEQLLKIRKEVSAFPLREYWLDIGRMDDYQKANGEFEKVFTERLDK